MRWIHRAISFLFLGALITLTTHARAQTVIWSDDFESGPAQWTASGFWHWIRDTNACAGPAVPFASAFHCMWYGIDGQCNFDNGHTNGGSLTKIASIALPPSGQGITLRYKNWRNAELCGCGIGGIYDECRVEVSINNGQSWMEMREECDPQFEWRKGRVDLTAFAGASIRIRFRFDSVDEENNNTLGWMVDDVAIQTEAGQSYCETTGCACTSIGASCAPDYNVGGCQNSTSTQAGAELYGAGTAMLSADDIVLTVVDVPPTASVLFLQGDVLSNGVTFGDGLRCVGGSLVRFGTKAAVDGVASYPEGSEPPVSVASLVGGTGTRGYQAYYRDPTPYCTSATFNLSNGYKLNWAP